jgi:uncharacterized membrane protein YdbT with pleckstrin-like domain
MGSLQRQLQFSDWGLINPKSNNKAMMRTFQLNYSVKMGRYVNNNLIKDERVELEATYHWIIFCNLRAVFTLFLAPLIDKYSDEFVITNKRVIIKTGLISRKTFEMNHRKIESLNVDQSILGRILGYGTLRIVGSGGSREIFPNIQSPLVFRKKFQEMSHSLD